VVSCYRRRMSERTKAAVCNIAEAKAHLPELVASDFDDPLPDDVIAAFEGGATTW